MRVAAKSRLCPLVLGVLSTAVVAIVPLRTHAGELTVAWSAAGPAAYTGYRVYVGERPGSYDRVIDAGRALRTTVTDLPDGKLVYFAVKAYDGAGNESSEYSPELACMAKPRVTSVTSKALHPGGSAWVTLEGANFGPDVQVRSNDSRLRVRTTTLEPDGRLSVLLEALEGSSDVLVPQVSSFTVLNPCRRVDAFFEAHPQAADVDGSGTVDRKDVDLVSAAIGSHRGDSGYVVAADLDGDGVIDGQDLVRVTALAGSSSSSPSGASTGTTTASR